MIHYMKSQRRAAFYSASHKNKLLTGTFIDICNISVDTNSAAFPLEFYNTSPIFYAFFNMIFGKLGFYDIINFVQL